MVKHLPLPAQEGLIAGIAGLALYGAAAGIERVLGTGANVSAILEESGKAALLLLAGWLGTRARTRQAASERNPARRTRILFLGTARGLSLGLVAIAVFIGAENLAYFMAFPEASILGRLFWSLPVHLVAALAEALGALFLFRRREGTLWRRLVGVSLWIGTLALATAWHLAANVLVSNRLSFTTFIAGTLLAILLALVLLTQFLKQAYLGGFLHGAD